LEASLKARVFGRVQGVFFRAAAEREASALSLSGWVANLPDGSVEVEAEGRREALERFLSWLRSGPPSACVERVEWEWGAFSGAHDGFVVRRR
jgi:acylphosphatase